MTRAQLALPRVVDNNPMEVAVMAQRTTFVRPQPGLPTTDSDWTASVASHISPVPDGCWAWNNDLDHYGYFRGEVAHRAVYREVKGGIPLGMHLHHVCENPGCVNPQHLVPVDPRVHPTVHADIRDVRRDNES